jgi:uncharacterized protein YqgC (DUF456 family)
MTRTRATLVFFVLTMTFLISPFVAVLPALAALVLALEFLPATVAYYRRHHNRLAILVLTLLSSAADVLTLANYYNDSTLTGVSWACWLAALVWSCTAVTRELTAAEIGPTAVASALNV